MKAARLYGKEDLRVVDVPVPEIGEKEILLKVRSTAICGTDIRMYKNGVDGIDENNPVTLGHEIAGTIETVGAGITEYSPGTDVVVQPNMGCGVCDLCVSGNTQLCPNYHRALGINLDGGFAEYVRIPEKAVVQGNLAEIPEGTSLELAAIAEPFSCVYNAFERCSIRPGDSVLVIGAGPIGILHGMLAKLAGASPVMLHDLSDERLEIAEKLEPFFTAIPKGKLKERVYELTGGKGADVGITAAPSPQAQIDAMDVAAVNGTVIFFGGLPKDKAKVLQDSNIVHYKQIWITGTTRSNMSQFRRSLKLIADKRVDVSGIVTHKFPLEKIQKAFEQVIQGKGMKSVVTFG
jgi:L-iditol 2-dehydrogenase